MVENVITLIERKEYIDAAKLATLLLRSDNMEESGVAPQLSIDKGLDDLKTFLTQLQNVD